ncbi:MAG: HAD family hydrolase [Bacteriovoracaceae bacterium]|jgi:HAD superfamily hydrolase (TIGR01549 family)|nr:HAD family hydrolase [Bacteriovoracaceae bacterium]
MRFQGVIFDLDGTIVDSQLDFDLMRQEIGIPNKKPILEYLARQTDQNFIKNAFEIIHQHELKGAINSTLIRDFKSFYDLLTNKNIPTAILTRNSLEVAIISIKKHQLKFDQVLSRDCAKAKPHPDGIFKICKKWNLNPKNILYIGDYKFDIETAANAGATSALILNKNNNEFKQSADIVFEEYKELIRYFKKSVV